MEEVKGFFLVVYKPKNSWDPEKYKLFRSESGALHFTKSLKDCIWRIRIIQLENE